MSSALTKVGAAALQFLDIKYCYKPTFFNVVSAFVSASILPTILRSVVSQHAQTRP